MEIFLDSDWSEWQPSYAWAIEHPEGVIVVDTGQSHRLMALAGRSMHPYLRSQARFDIQPEQEIGPQLKQLGISPTDVRHVVLTHMHVDHDAGLAHFPHSEIHVGASEFGRARGVFGALRG